MRGKDRASVSMDESDADRSNDRVIPVNALRVRFEDIAGLWVAQGTTKGNEYQKKDDDLDVDNDD